MKRIEALELGATLFIPAKHKNIEAIIFEQKYPDLRAVVLDFEDGLDEKDIDCSLNQFEKFLADERSFCVLVCVRPRDTTMFEMLLTLKNIERIDAFVLPKFSLQNAQEYLLHVKEKELYIMPSIEGLELFDIALLKELRTLLLEYKENIVVMRFGAEDMLRQLGLKRQCSRSLFEIKTTAHCITNFIMTFKPYGFDIAAPVYPCYENRSEYIRQVEEEIAEGLISKTIIHPNQIEPLHVRYKVSSTMLEEARELLSSNEAVFASSKKMAEVRTQRAFSELVCRRFELYGCIK